MQHPGWCEQSHRGDEPHASDWAGHSDDLGHALARLVQSGQDETPAVQLALRDGETGTETLLALSGEHAAQVADVVLLLAAKVGLV
jgi:hypothetical protein